VLIPSLIAPFAGLFIAAALMVAITWVIRRRSPGNVNRVFRRLQLVSGGFVAFTHGTNDAQKTMGSSRSPSSQGSSRTGRRPAALVIVSAALAMGAGTYAGGLADHQDARHEDREARPAAGLRRTDGLRLDPLDDRTFRLPGLDDAHDLRQRHGRRRVAEALGRALGRRPETS
jgi:hypothetical protein